MTGEHGHFPGSSGSSWLYAKLFLSAQRMDHLLVHELPALLAVLGDRARWFVRYPQAREGEEPDHLRLRIRVHGDLHCETDRAFAAVSGWADRLRSEGLIGRLGYDTYPASRSPSGSSTSSPGSLASAHTSSGDTVAVNWCGTCSPISCA